MSSSTIGIGQYLGWPLLSFIAGLIGFLFIFFPGIISSKNQYGQYAFWSWPLLILPSSLRRGGARLLGAALLCQALLVGLIAHDAAVHSVRAAESREELFCPVRVRGNSEQEGLYLHRLLVEIRKSKPEYQFGTESPMLLKVSRSTMDPRTYEFNLLGREFYQLGPEAASRQILGSIENGGVRESALPEVSEFPTADEADALLEQATVAWQQRDHDRSLRLASRALEIRRSLMGDHHPRVREVEQMIARAQSMRKGH
jgi:hypothetical protein